MGKTLRILVAAEALSTELLEILAERHTYKWMKIIDQIQASAISVAHCIAEGHGRTTTGEKMQMLSAKGDGGGKSGGGRSGGEPTAAYDEPVSYNQDDDIPF